jgi:hypothetical protein
LLFLELTGPHGKHALEAEGMVISCTCDTQPEQGEFVLVAPVFDLDDYRTKSELKGQDLDNHIRALTHFTRREPPDVTRKI